MRRAPDWTGCRAAADRAAARLPDDADPCKHPAAACYLVSDALDADPFVLLLLPGAHQGAGARRGAGTAAGRGRGCVFRDRCRG